MFIEVFDEESNKLEGVRWLAQGTIYPDVIESAGAKTGKAHVIKSHHNVGGLPEHMKLKLVEPLRELFKDEVRRLGLELGLPRVDGVPPSVPGPGPRRAHPRRSVEAVRRPAAQGRQDLHRRAARARSLRQDQPGVRRVPAGALGGRDGRRAPLRLRDRAARGRDRRLHDRALGAPAVRVPRPLLAPHHQRGDAASRASSTTSPASRRRRSSGSERRSRPPMHGLLPTCAARSNSRGRQKRPAKCRSARCIVRGGEIIGEGFNRPISHARPHGARRDDRACAPPPRAATATA